MSRSDTTARCIGFTATRRTTVYMHHHAASSKRYTHMRSRKDAANINQQSAGRQRSAAILGRTGLICSWVLRQSVCVCVCVLIRAF